MFGSDRDKVTGFQNSVIMGSFIIINIHQILLDWSNHGGCALYMEDWEIYPNFCFANLKGSFIISNIHQILLDWSNHGGCGSYMEDWEIYPNFCFANLKQRHLVGEQK